MMSSPSRSVAETDADADGLDLESLDAESLFAALTNVEKAIPELLSSVKPILSHLISPTSNTSSRADEEAAGTLARESVERYMTLLDKIQFVLRQTVYYLRETRTSPNTLRPPAIDSIPTPFVSTLPLHGPAGETGQVELGLYASRIEARTLREFKSALRALREGQVSQAEHAGVDMDADPHTNAALI